MAKQQNPKQNPAVEDNDNSSSKKILTLQEKKDLQDRRFKDRYGFDISTGQYLIFEESVCCKKHKETPGVIYIKGKGILIGAYRSRADAAKQVKILEKSLELSILNKLRVYKIEKVSSGLRINLINEGLRLRK